MGVFKKMSCPYCSGQVTKENITQKRKAGDVEQTRCPHCSLWLRLNPRTERIKNTGISMMAAFSVAGLFVEQDYARLGFNALVAFGGLMALIAFWCQSYIEAYERPAISKEPHRQ